MKLYLIRHAPAVESFEAASDDARPLTGEGRAKFAEQVRGLARLDLRFDLVVHSPLRRAVETAELLEPLLEGEMQVSAHLAGPPAEALLDELRGATVAAVGHEPWLSELVAWLTTGERAQGHVFAFKKGGVAVLEGPPRPSAMSLVAVLPPSVLRELGRER